MVDRDREGYVRWKAWTALLITFGVHTATTFISAPGSERRPLQTQRELQFRGSGTPSATASTCEGAFSSVSAAAFLVGAAAAYTRGSRLTRRSRPKTRRRAGGEVAVEGGIGKWLAETQEFWEALEIFTGPSLEEDEDPAAKAVVDQLNKVEKIRQETDEIVSKKSYLRGKANVTLGNALNEVPLKIIDYYKMKIARVFDKQAVKKGITSSFTYFNLIFIVIFFRTVVPRLLAVQNMDDLFLVANELGVPSKANLQAGLQSIQGYDVLTKLAYFQAAFIVEKLTLVSEILPVQIGLKTVSPLIFGGLFQGALASAVCETVGATINFAIGRATLTQQLEGFSLFMEKPLGEQKWFGRLQNAAKNEGLKLVLLLRIAHVLPIPFDSYWYILGALPVSLEYFVAGHFLGCLKTCFLDASLGELLLTSVALEDSAKQSFAAAEATGFAIVALAVSVLATALAKDFLGIEDEEQSSTEVTTDVEGASSTEASASEGVGLGTQSKAAADGKASKSTEKGASSEKKVVAETTTTASLLDLPE